MDLSLFCMGCMGKKNAEGLCPNCGWVEGSEPLSMLHLPPRTILSEKYLLGKVLGQGGFGVTYLARDIYLDRKLALKEYFPRELVYREKGSAVVTLFSKESREQYDYGLEKFLGEGKTLARLEGHPNIVAVKDFFKANNSAYLVMSFVEGSSLADLLIRRGKPLAYDQALQIIMPVLDALRAIHALDLLHRDISPDNIYITIQGRVIILDFGAARQALGEKGKNLSVILKPGYAPLEQYRSSGEQGPWTDIYAAGITFYQAITGKLPPDSLSRMEKDPLIPPSQLGVDIPPRDETVLLKALAVRREDRFQSVEAFQEALKPFFMEKAVTWEGSSGERPASGNDQVNYSHDEPKSRPPSEDQDFSSAARTPAAANGDLHFYRPTAVINIGRAPDNDLILGNGTVSRYHARIFKQDEKWHLTDLDSTHGTTLDGRQISTPVEIRPSALITISGNNIFYDGQNLVAEDGSILINLDKAVSAPGAIHNAVNQKKLLIIAAGAVVLIMILILFINNLLR